MSAASRSMTGAVSGIQGSRPLDAATAPCGGRIIVDESVDLPADELVADNRDHRVNIDPRANLERQARPEVVRRWRRRHGG